GVLAPTNRDGDLNPARLDNGVVRTSPGFKEAYAQFIEAGWNGMPFDPDFGGQGLPWLVSTAVQEVWHAANMSFGLCPMLTQGAVEALLHHADDAIKATYLPKMIAGEWTGTMNLTEPQAGTDLGALRSKAEPEGDHYRISGQKIFITFGEQDYTDNIVHLVLARTPDAPPGPKGISLFVVPKFMVNPDGSLGARNDVRCVSLEHKLGIHGSPTAVMSFGDDGGAIGYLVGQENQGLAHMFTMMNNERLAVGLQGVGVAERAYQAAVSYAKERVQSRALGATGPGPSTIIQHPDVRRMLLTMRALVQAGRALAYYTAAKIDAAERHPDADARRAAQSRVDLLTPVVKAWCSDNAIEVANIGIQVHGGMGFIEETGAAQYLRDARITAIYEGTNGVQANDLIGRKVARDGGAAQRDLIADLRRTAEDLAANGGPDLEAIGDRLTAGTDALERATEWLVPAYGEDPRVPSAGATHYLELMGTVTGGWMLAHAALAAHDRRARGVGDPDFDAAKIATARFFAEHRLCRAAGLAAAFMGGGGTVLAMAEDWF
ncbi:MAG: acyl-CoA dehydrogenase, partial [Rhodobacterales bacterium]|nr:acyl-CoA dehydrogenase [Rhodobacterales bacterium]